MQAEGGAQLPVLHKTGPRTHHAAHTYAPTFAQPATVCGHSPHNVCDCVWGAAVPQQRHFRPHTQHPRGGAGGLVPFALALLLLLVPLLLGLPRPERVLVLRTPVGLKAVRLGDSGRTGARQAYGVGVYSRTETHRPRRMAGEAGVAYPDTDGGCGGGSVLPARCQPC